jgi:hypothetical protein
VKCGLYVSIQQHIPSSLCSGPKRQQDGHFAVLAQEADMHIVRPEYEKLASVSKYLQTFSCMELHAVYKT